MNCKFFVRGLILVSIFLASSVMSCLADDSTYRELLLELIQKGDSRNFLQKKEKIVSLYAPLLVSMGCPEELAMQRSNKFYDEVFYVDMVNWLESVYKQSVTEQDLRAGIAFFSSPAASLATEHSAVYNDDKVQAQSLSKITPDILKIAVGEKPGKISTSLPKSYQKIFREYYKLSGQEESVSVLMKQIVSMASIDNEKMSENLVKYLDENMQLLMMESGYPTMTETDLKVLSDFFKTEAGKKFSKTNSEILRNVMKFSMSEVLKFQLAQKNWREEETAKTDSTATLKETEP